jgi:mersacidin/lichenicidin family type 2 lantibiotic
MSHEDIIRAWKDEDYRNSLSEEQRAQLPENPAGMVELSNESMQAIAGGAGQQSFNNTNPLPVCVKTVTLTCGCTIKLFGKNRC